jgi:hypothetical protein
MMKGEMEDLNAPASKSDNEQLRFAIEQFRSDMNHNYRDLVERFDHGTTRLLNAFDASTETNSKRIALVEDNDAALRSRLGTLEDRMMAVEKRLNRPA